MEEKRKLRLEALKQLAQTSTEPMHVSDDKEYLDKIKLEKATRALDIGDKYRGQTPVSISRENTNAAYDKAHEGMSQEEKEQAAGRELSKKRKEAGLE